MTYSQASFLARLKQDPDGCREWTGWTDKWGYGHVSAGTPAHRFAWQLFVGPIPPGMEVDHLCFNPPCVRIDHLRLLPASENHRRQRSAFKTHCVKGHEFTPENTYIKTPRYGQGVRQCRKCNLEAVRRYQARRKAALAVAS